MPKLIRNWIEIPTTTDHHGDGQAFILMDDGNLYYTASSESHGFIFLAIEEKLGFDPNSERPEFYDYMEDHILAHGRFNDQFYKLYVSSHPQYNELLPEIKKELAEEGLKEADYGEYLGAAQYNFVHVPSQHDTHTPDSSWRSLIIDTFNHIVYYGDKNKFHASVIEGIDDLADTNAQDSGDFWNDERWIAGEYNYRGPQVKFFGSHPGDWNEVPPTMTALTGQIMQYFENEVHVAHIDNPWYILRKPFFWDENEKTLFIGKTGTGFLYDSSFTLDTYVPNVVKEALVKLTINQAGGEWGGTDEPYEPSYWEKQPNYIWWTSWIWIPSEERLLVKNQSNVNHAQLLMSEEVMPHDAVFGIITKDTDDRSFYQIVPYYSDVALYDEVPEFLDRENANQDVDRAVQEVQRWLMRVKHLDPRNVTVHEAAEVKPLDPDEPFYNWQGHEYRFEPSHEGVDREGVNAYDGADLIGSITWTDEGDFYYLRSAYVDPAYRGEGIFKELLGHMPADKPVEGEWERGNPLDKYFHNYNRRFAAIRSEDQKKALEEAIFDNYVNFDPELAWSRTNDLLRMVDVDVSELDFDAQVIRATQIRAENARQAEELRKQWEHQQQIDSYWVEVRYGLNRKTGEWWIVPSSDMTIHPNMLMEWTNNDYDNVDWHQNFDELSNDYVFGYAAFNPYDKRTSVDEDESYDLPGAELTPEEERQLKLLLDQWAETGGEGNFKGKVASTDEPNIVDLGDWKDRGLVFVYNIEDDTLAVAPWNRLHSSVIKEVWGTQMEDRGYKHLVAGVWKEPIEKRAPEIVYGEDFGQAKRALTVIKDYVNSVLEPPKTSASLDDHIEIIDTSGKIHHGMGWPFLYDQKYDKLYFGNTEAFHSDLIESMGQERMNDIWLRYYQEDKDAREFMDDQPVSILGGRYDPQNTYEPYMFYDFMPVDGQVKWRIKELVDQAMTMVPPIDYEAKVSAAPQIEIFEDNSDKGHDAWVWYKPDNRLWYMYNGHHLDMFMSMKDSEPEMVKQMMDAYGGLNEQDWIIGDVEMGYKDDAFQPVISAWVKDRPPEIDALVINLWKQRRKNAKTATTIQEVDTSEQHANDIHDDSHRTPFIYVSTRDTIYIGSLNSHHTDVIFTVFDSDNPEEEQEMYSIEDNPGNLGVILNKGEILYWGEPHDNVIRAMQERFPDYPQKMFDYYEDLRFSRVARTEEVIARRN